MGDVEYVSGVSRNLLSTLKAVKQWGKPLIYNRWKTILGLPGEESLVFDFCPRKGLFLATGMRWIPSQEVALGSSIAEAGSAKTCVGAALVVAAKARNMIEVHRMLAHASEHITWKMAEAMSMLTGQWGF